MSKIMGTLLGVIYKATDLTGKCYIGKRQGDGFDVGKTYFGSGVYLKRSIKKYGKESFSYWVFEKCCSLQDLNEKEKYYIKFFNSQVPNGYNLSVGGDGRALGSVLSEETKNKMLVANKITAIRPEVKLKRRITRENRSEEEKRLTKQKQSDSLKEYNADPKVRAQKSNFRKGVNPLRSKTPQEIQEINRKNSESNKISQNNPETIKKKSEASKRSWSNKSDEEKRLVKEKQSIALSGSKNPMYGKNAYTNKTSEEMKEISNKKSKSMKKRLMK